MNFFLNHVVNLKLKGISCDQTTNILLFETNYYLNVRYLETQIIRQNVFP